MKGHVVIAPDKFKGSLTAPEVAARVAAGLGDTFETVELPVADGGDGTVEAVVACGFARVEVEVTGPSGERVTASYGWASDDGTAVVELAEASGLRRLSAGPAPLTATSYGTGELIAHAVRRGARRVVLGLGGSACTDGGAGMIQALGVRLLDGDGCPLGPGGAALRDLVRVDVSGLADLSGVEFVVASDVDNPLLGPHGAAAVYAPQKGALPGDVEILEAALTHFADLAAPAVHQITSRGPGSPITDPILDRSAGATANPLVDRGAGAEPVVGRGEGRVTEPIVDRGAGAVAEPVVDAGTGAGMGTGRGGTELPFEERAGAGAAGGVGFAAMAFLGAEIRPGIDYLLDLLHFDEHLEGAGLVITGEGSLDEQSLRGKAPVGVAVAAAKHGIPVIAVCGRRTLTDAELRDAGILAAYALTDLEPDPAVCMAEAGPLLERLATLITADIDAVPRRWS